MFVNGQTLRFLLSQDNVVQAIIVMLTMNFRVQQDLGLVQAQAYVRLLFLAKCGPQQTTSLSRVLGDTTNPTMQLKTHVRLAQLVLHVAILRRNQPNVYRELFLQLLEWVNVSYALLDSTVMTLM